MNENETPHPDAGKDEELDAKQGAGTQRQRHEESLNELAHYRDTRGNEGDTWKQIQENAGQYNNPTHETDSEATVNQTTIDALSQERMTRLRTMIAEVIPGYSFSETESLDDLDGILRKALIEKMGLQNVSDDEMTGSLYRRFKGR